MRVFFLVCLLFCINPIGANSKIQFGYKKYIEYRVGEIPVVLTAPHGGRIVPETIPDRTYGVLVPDANTDYLAIEIFDAILKLTGKKPHLVLCHLRRSKLDANRDLEEAAQANKTAMRAWKEYHGFIEHALKVSVQKFKSAIYLDIHGHGHKLQLVELGYLVSKKDLLKSEKDLNKLRKKSSLVALSNSKGNLVELIRGEKSFGTLLEKKGFPSVPSQFHPAPTGKYFSGGYCTKRYCKKKNVIGFQVECYKKGIRDKKVHREKFAQAFTLSLIEYLNTHMNYSFIKK